MKTRITHDDVQARLKKNMAEVHRNTPSTVQRANVKGKRKEKMLRAIAFAKTRRGE